MIGASNDQRQQEQLIEKYMQLPNQVWDDIINQVPKGGLCTSAIIMGTLAPSSRESKHFLL